VNKSRIEAVSDGVFAIAITLLVLTISEPDDYSHLARELGDRWPSLAAYVVSFAVIGIMWLNHHSIFAHFERVDRALFYLNLLLLMTISFLPYPTGVLGHALREGEGTRTAAVVYSVTMAINAFAWGSLWLYASSRRRLLRPSFPESERRTATLLFTAGTITYSASIVVAVVNAYVCLAFHAATALYYALDPVSRRSARSETPDRASSSADFETPPRTPERVLLAVAGAHLEGQPLNHELTDRRARLVRRTATARAYRLYALDTDPPKPGLVRVPSDSGDAGSIDVEVWALSPPDFAGFVDHVPSPLVIGRVLLDDGTDVAGFLCEPSAVDTATDITRFGGWRAFLAATGERR
jgi:uncharacterized membrane protein